MTSTEVTAERIAQPAPWAGVTVLSAVLLAGGLLPGWTVDPLVLRWAGSRIEAAGGGEVEHHLLVDAEWPYYLALVLALGGTLTATAAHRRSPAWVAPAVLTVTVLPALALVTELYDLDPDTAPYSHTVDAAVADANERIGPYVSGTSEVYTDVHLDTGAGGWITFWTMFALTVGAVLWLGRTLDFLAHRRWAVATLAGVVTLTVVGWKIADVTAPDTCGPATLVDRSAVQPYWEAWLVLYLPAALGLAGIGVLTRRRITSGLLLLTACVAAYLGMLIVGVEVAGRCLE